VAVEFLHQVIAPGGDDVFVPLAGFFDAGFDFLGVASAADGLGFFILVELHLLPDLGDDAAAALFVADAGVIVPAVHIGLIAADDETTHVLAAILNAGVVIFQAPHHAQLEILDLAATPDEERVTVGLI